MNFNAGLLVIVVRSRLRLLVVLIPVGVLRGVIHRGFVPAKVHVGVAARHGMDLNGGALRVDVFHRVVATGELVDFD